MSDSYFGLCFRVCLCFCLLFIFIINMANFQEVGRLRLIIQQATREIEDSRGLLGNSAIEERVLMARLVAIG